jgi:hypothetical protein
VQEKQPHDLSHDKYLNFALRCYSALSFLIWLIFKAKISSGIRENLLSFSFVVIAVLLFSLSIYGTKEIIYAWEKRKTSQSGKPLFQRDVYHIFIFMFGTPFVLMSFIGSIFCLLFFILDLS